MIPRTGWVAFGIAVLCAGTLAAAPASACWQCDGIACVIAEGGARSCFYGVGGCTVMGACGDGEGPGPRADADGAMALQLTWLETSAPPAGPRVVRGAGRRVFGAPAARALRAVGSGPGEPATVVAAVAGFGAAFDVVLRGEAGDGVALAWAADGRGGRVTIRSLEPGATGGVVADESLADSDALVLPVRYGGRAWALVVQPRVLPRLSVRLETADLVRTARDAVRPGRPRLAIGVAAIRD